MPEHSPHLLELNEHASLQDIYFQREIGQRLDQPRGEDGPLQIGLSVGRRTDAETGPDVQFRFVLKVRIEASRGDVEVQSVAVYSIGRELEHLLTDTVLYEYANEVAVMALMPYVRQRVTDISSRVLGQTILLPVLQRGQLHFEPNPPSGDEELDHNK